jgi:hypothetical protein
MAEPWYATVTCCVIHYTVKKVDGKGPKYQGSGYRREAKYDVIHQRIGRI